MAAAMSGDPLDRHDTGGKHLADEGIAGIVGALVPNPRFLEVDAPKFLADRLVTREWPLFVVQEHGPYLLIANGSVVSIGDLDRSQVASQLSLRLQRFMCWLQ
ncbi:hypothetical protein [Halomonas shantousis]